MIGRLMSYGALMGKVRAMYGNRLTYEDYKHILQLGGVSEIGDYLKNHPSWSKSIHALPTGLHRKDLESLLRLLIFDEYLRIFKFMPGSDHELMRFPVTRAEMEEFLRCYRLVKAGRHEEYHFNLPDFFRRNSRVDFSALSSASGWQSMLDAVSAAEFYPLLVRLNPPSGSFPEYTAVEVVLQSYFFNRTLKVIGDRYGGDVYGSLRQWAACQVDLLNIIRTIRIKRYFPDSSIDFDSILLPSSGRIRPSYLRSLSELSSRAEMEAFLRSGPYGDVFTDLGEAGLDKYYYSVLLDFNRRLLSRGIPSVLTAVSYISIKEIELKNIITSIECVRYGLPPEESVHYLVGM